MVQIYDFSLNSTLLNQRPATLLLVFRSNP